MLKNFILLISLSLGAQTVSAQDTLDLFPEQKGSLMFWSRTLDTPRPLKIHYLRADLTCRNLEVFTLPGNDPDGSGPAESELTSPSDLITRYHALAAINANAFAGLRGTENDIRGWYKNRPVDIQGMVVSDGKVVSPAQSGRTAFWLDTLRHTHIGDTDTQAVRQAVSDWSTPLLINNKIIPDSTVSILHPRSALGFDESGKWLLLMVVDGRQKGYSEGVSLHELAKLFKAEGCTQSINLDGGGSSIMLIQYPGGEIKTVNRPSGLTHRPIPVMLGIRAVHRK